MASKPREVCPVTHPPLPESSCRVRLRGGGKCRVPPLHVNLEYIVYRDISVFVPCEFAADVDTKVLGRSDSLKCSAMEVVLCLYWSSFPCKGDGLTLGRTELHQPVLFSFLETVKVGMECVGVVHSVDGTVQQYRQSAANISTVEQTLGLLRGGVIHVVNYGCSGTDVTSLVLSSNAKCRQLNLTYKLTRA